MNTTTTRPLRFARFAPGIYMSKIDLTGAPTYGIACTPEGWHLNARNQGPFDGTYTIGTYPTLPAAKSAAAAHRAAYLDGAR